MRISGISDPEQNKTCKKLNSDDPKVAKKKMKPINTHDYNFNLFETRHILMLSKRYKSTKVDCRT